MPRHDEAGDTVPGATRRHPRRPTRRLVLVHGFTGSAESWGAPLLDVLEQAGVTVVAVDLPGHGVRAAGGRPIALSDALGVIDDAVGTETAAVLGYSMGGRIALHYAVRRPGRVERLILESASAGLATEEEREARRRADEDLATRIVEGGIEAFVREWEHLPLFSTRASLPAEVVASERARRLRNDPASLAAALEGLGTGRLPSLWERLGEVRMPTLLMAGGGDAKFVDISARMAAAIPGARSTVVDGVGHTVHLEAPRAWADEVLGFLADE